MTRFQRYIKFRLIIFSVIILTAIISVIHTAVYTMSRNLIEAELISNAQGVAVAVAHFVSNDIESYKAFLSKVDQYKATFGVHSNGTVLGNQPMPREMYEDDPYHSRFRRVFRNIKEDNRVRFIYTQRAVDDKIVEFILDSMPIDAPDHSPPGSTYDGDPTSIIAYNEGITTAFRLNYYEGWGYLLGAHAPIFDRDGTVVGVAGVDISGSHVASYLDRLQLILLVIYAFLVIVTLVVVTRFSVVIMEPLLKDRLTGAYTKRYAERLIQEEMAVAVKEKNDLTLMVLDLDHFKNINDTYGHAFGDKVLSAVSGTIQKALRQKDYFIRYGGEEFIALFPNVDKNRAADIAERIRESVSNTDITDDTKGISVKITISIGIACIAHFASNAVEFIDLADKALYVAKKTRNCSVFYTKDTEQLLADSEERGTFKSSSVMRRRG